MSDNPPARRYVASLRVRSYEMDSLGHVNNAVYLHYFEHAAWEHSYSVGLTRERYAELGGIFVMRRFEIDYLRPAVAGDRLDIATWIGEMRGARAVRNYEITRAGNAETLARATSVWAWIETSSGRPRPIPAEILAIFAAARAAQS